MKTTLILRDHLDERTFFIFKQNEGLVDLQVGEPHSGWVGAVVSDMNLDGSIDTSEILQSADFMPFGVKFGDAKTGDYHYDRDGSERQTSFDMDYALHAFRDYDPSSGIWMSPEPLSVVFSEWSSYSGMGNNPVNNIDPLGLDWYRNNDTGEMHWQEGSDDLDGHKNIGANYTIYGATQMIVHHQNEVERLIDYADLAPDHSSMGLSTPNDMSAYEFTNSFLSLTTSSLVGTTLLLEGNSTSFTPTSKYYSVNGARLLNGLSALSLLSSSYDYGEYVYKGGNIGSFETVFYTADLFFATIGSRSWQGAIAAGAWEVGKQIGGYKNYLELKYSSGGLDGVRSTKY